MCIKVSMTNASVVKHKQQKEQIQLPNCDSKNHRCMHIVQIYKCVYRPKSGKKCGCQIWNIHILTKWLMRTVMVLTHICRHNLRFLQRELWSIG